MTRKSASDQCLELTSSKNFRLDDRGAYFRFNFGDLRVGETREFSIYYGAAPTEAAAFAALSAENIELFSLGQNSNPGGSDIGEPATFIFVFAAVGGTPVPVPVPGALGMRGLGFLGMGMALCRQRQQQA